MKEFGIVLFYTTSAVMAADKQLAERGITVKIVPTPLQFTSDSGIALRFAWEHCDEIRAALEKEHIEYEEIWQL